LCNIKKTSFWKKNIYFKNKSVPFFLNNQPDTLIIQILFCYKTLHVSGIFCAHRQEFSTVHSALVSFMQVFDDRFPAESGWNFSSILTLLGIISASGWLFKKKCITTHGNVNVNSIPFTFLSSELRHLVCQSKELLRTALQEVQTYKNTI
jgi:hypothetical protein